MDLGIDRKVALVAGGARGSGLAIAKCLADEGVRVVLTSREAELAEQAASEIRDSGRVAVGICGDMTSAGGPREIVAAARDALGMPDILIVNPPSPRRVRSLLDATTEDFVHAHERWVLSLVGLVQAAIPAMVEARWGRIVALGSMGMKTPHLKDPVYTLNVRVATAAVMKTVAAEYGPYNITANTLAPGRFDTSLADGYMAEPGALSADTRLAGIPLGRLGRPEELAAVATFLCSRQASYLTGEVIRVDGNASGSLF
jgi:3-oxoacyl-[acyl-carrier protein] reductase